MIQSCGGRPKSLGYQQLTGLSTAKKLTVPPGANFAVIRVEGVSVRYRDDSGDPTSSIGMLLLASEILQYDSAEGIQKLSFIETAPSASVNVLYYGV